MKKSFFILLFSVIGFSFLSAQEKSAEPIQKQTNTVNQQKLQRVYANPEKKKSIELQKSTSIKSVQPASEKNYKHQDAELQRKSMVESKESEAIEPKNSDN